MTFGQAWKDFWVGYFDFKGMSTCAGFWWGTLDYFIIDFVWDIISSFVEYYNICVLQSIGLNKTMFLIHLGLLIPMLSVLTRRLHDTGLKEGIIYTLVILYILLMLARSVTSFTVLIGIILHIVFTVLGCMPTGNFNK